MSKILITGASSLIGEAITKFARLEKKHEVILLSSNADKFKPRKNLSFITVDAQDYKSIKQICYELKPDAIINTVSLTDPERCESDKKLAYELNVNVVDNLIKICKVIDAHLISFSSEMVFDGERGPYLEEAKPNPINYFGKTKHASENLLITGLKNYTIIRTTCPYGDSSFDKQGFVQRTLSMLENNEEFEVSDIHFSNPVYVDDIGQTAMKVLENQRLGIYNISGTDWISKYFFAKTIARIFEFDDSIIKPLTEDKFPQVVKYPKKSGLVALKSSTDLGIKLTSVENGLSAFRFHNNEKARSYFRDL